jgi:DnaJ-class molecular chaperone
VSEHYAALGLKSDATLADIKKAFRQKASQFHPDRNTNPDAPARFREVQEAYDVLSDSDRRKAYDDNRRRNLLDDPAQTARDIWDAYFQEVLNRSSHTRHTP